MKTNNENAKNSTPLSYHAREILTLLKDKETLTLSEIKKMGITSANSSHLIALKNRGLVSSKMVTITELKPVKRKVLAFTIINKQVKIAQLVSD